MNRQMLCLLALLLSAPLAVAQTAAPSADPGVPMQVTAPEEDASLDDDKKLKPSDRHCLRQTGSRITARRAADSRRCAAIGRVYTQDDLRRTGHIDVADALRTLDPSIY
jgi:hypothetical protein